MGLYGHNPCITMYNPFISACKSACISLTEINHPNSPRKGGTGWRSCASARHGSMVFTANSSSKSASLDTPWEVRMAFMASRLGAAGSWVIGGKK